MHTTIAQFVETYDHWFLCILVAIESFGVPLPGETALVTAAAYAALGRLTVVFVIIAAAGGAIVRDNADYWLGRNGSIALVLLAMLVVLVIVALRVFRHYRESIAAFVIVQWARFANSPWARHRTRYPRLWMFVAGRFVRGEYLGVHLTVGFVVSVSALWLFGDVTEDVLHHHPLTAVDLALGSWFRAHATPMGDRIGVAISLLGSPATMAAIGSLVAAALVYRRWWITLSGWVAAFAGGDALNWLLKHIIHRARPVGAEDFLYGTSFSFPSGHAMGSLIGYGMLAYVLVTFTRARRQRTTVFIAVFTMTLLIGLSRLYLGVHFLSDVIAGYAAGTVWLAVCVTGVEIALRQRGVAP